MCWILKIIMSLHIWRDYNIKRACCKNKQKPTHPKIMNVVMEWDVNAPPGSNFIGNTPLFFRYRCVNATNAVNFLEKRRYRPYTNKDRR